MRRAASSPLLLALALTVGAGALAGADRPQPLETGRCLRDLPLDAGQDLTRQRHLIWNDSLYLFEPDPNQAGAELTWKLAGRTSLATASEPSGPRRPRIKWRDGALWRQTGYQIQRWDPNARSWFLRADPGLEFNDFEVDLSGRILLVATADPRTRSYRALLEELGGDGKPIRILAPYPDPGCLEWVERVSPMAAASLQVSYETAQILDTTVLFNPLARRMFLFTPLDNRLREARLGLTRRRFQDLLPGPKGAPALDDLCWQVLPRGAAGAWLVMPAARDPDQPVTQPRGLQALAVDLGEATADPPQPLAATQMPLFPDRSGQLRPLQAALEDPPATARHPPPGAAGPVSIH